MIVMLIGFGVTLGALAIQGVAVAAGEFGACCSLGMGRNHADHGGSAAYGVRADGFEDRIEVDLRPNRCRVAQIVVKDGGDSDGDPRGHDGSGMVFAVDDDAAVRRWKARFVRLDCGSQSSPRLRMSSAELTRTCLRNSVLNSSPNAS